ncbi:MAG: ABC transporter permease [Candidatus Helarchaeota archaeon]|nr:ABC transporter permease [Candidatus Helarchaeota archaeon]
MLGFDWSGIWGVTRRDIIKYFRSKNQIITSLLMPTIFMIFLRQGFGAVAQNPFFNYSNYIGAGIFCMTAVMGGLFMSGMPILFDKMMGFSDVLTVSPVDHKNLVFGFVLAGTFKITFQSSIIFAIAMLTGLLPVDHGLGVFGMILSVFPIYLILIIGAMAYASIGICIAARCDMQNAFLWTTICQIPLVFISGAMFPVTGFPPIVAQIASINPTTFLADAIRTFLGGEVGYAGTSNLVGGNVYLAYLIDLGAVCIFLIIMLNIAFKIYGRSLRESSGGFTGMVSKRMEKQRKKMMKGLDPESRDAMNILWNKFGAGDMPKLFMKMADGKMSEVEQMFTERGISKEDANRIFEAGMKMMEKMTSGKKK